MFHGATCLVVFSGDTYMWCIMKQNVSLFFQEIPTCDVSWSKMSHCSFRRYLHVMYHEAKCLTVLSGDTYMWCIMKQNVSLFLQEIPTCDVSWSKMSHCSFRRSIIICIGWTILEAEAEEKLVFNLSFAFLSTALVPSLFFLLLTLFVLFLLLVCSKSAENQIFLGHNYTITNA